MLAWLGSGWYCGAPGARWRRARLRSHSTRSCATTFGRCNRCPLPRAEPSALSTSNRLASALTTRLSTATRIRASLMIGQGFLHRLGPTSTPTLRRRLFKQGDVQPSHPLSFFFLCIPRTWPRALVTTPSACTSSTPQAGHPKRTSFCQQLLGGQGALVVPSRLVRFWAVPLATGGTDRSPPAHSPRCKGWVLRLRRAASVRLRSATSVRSSSTLTMVQELGTCHAAHGKLCST